MITTRTPLEHSKQANTSDKPLERTLLEEAGHLLRDPNLLDRIEEMMREQGLAGDTRASMTCYIAITSRHFRRPFNVAVIGTSSIGKNRKVDYARHLHPPDACHFVSASSERALIYHGWEDEEVFKNRVIIWAEADSMPEDGAAASAIRALVFDSEMVYEVTEKVNGKFTTRTIRKQGPTGLITTRTESLPHQHRTRVLEVVLEEDEAEIREVLRALAKEDEPGEPPDIRPLIALQEWLDHYGTKSVTIPYAEVLADLIPARSAVIQRQFPFLLTCIRTIAFLHQLQRERTADGDIVACLEDYAVARDLFAPSIDAVAGEGLTETLRETVEAVSDFGCVSLTDLAERLGIAKSTASRRVKQAISGGWIINTEWRRGLPAQLECGEPLPDVVESLPTVKQIMDAFDCQELPK